MKEQKNKADLSNGTIVVLGATLILFIVLLFFAIRTEAYALIAVGAGFFVLGILVTLPNLIAWGKGKHREALIRSGKLVEPQKKSYHPHSRFDDND